MKTLAVGMAPNTLVDTGRAKRERSRVRDCLFKRERAVVGDGYDRIAANRYAAENVVTRPCERFDHTAI